MTDSAYLLPNEVGNCFRSKLKTPLSLFHLNAQSVRNKFEQFDAFLEGFGISFDVIMLTETWYNQDDSVDNLENYYNYNLCRTSQRGGGVSMFIKKSIECNIVHQFTKLTDDYEILTVQCAHGVFSVMYRPPGGDMSCFNAFLETFFNFWGERHFKCVLGGDLNINMLEPTRQREQFSMLYQSYGYINVINEPTRFTAQNQTLLDLFLTNVFEVDVHAGVIGATISDHLPIYMFIDSSVNHKKKHSREFYYRDISHRNLERFREQISHTNWDSVFSKVSADEAYESFLETFSNIYNCNFQYKRYVNSKKCRKPWVTPDILKMMQKKNTLYQKFVLTKDLTVLSAFRKQRNRITSELRRSKRAYYNSLFLNVKRTEVVWKNLNAILHEGNKLEPITELTIEDEIKTGATLANAFNDFFVDLVNSVPSTEATRYVKSVPESIFFFPTDEEEVISIFTCLKNSKSCDINDIQIKPVKYVIKSIASILVYVFNLSIQTGIFPRKMQVAKVSVLYKTGDKNELGNYRPVSVLPIFSKGLEKIIHKRLYRFCEKHSILSPHQYGFRKGCSTELALLEQKELILSNIENRLLTLGIFIDFSKAFDRLNHETLLQKLLAYGVRGKALDIIRSYLQSRFQMVVIDGYHSNSRQMKNGVPQGSILGPLLFNLYINDIVNIDSKVHMIIYADDTSIFFSGRNTSELIEAGNRFLHKLNEWTISNSLVINSKKTKSVIFRSKGINNICQQQALTLGAQTIEMVKTVKVLGVMFNEYLRWDESIQSTAKKLSRVVGIIYKCREKLPSSVLLLIYNSLFYSCFNYCFLVWGNSTYSNINILYLLQKKAIRAICNEAYCSHTTPMFKRLGLIKITNYYDYKLILMYKTALNKPDSIFLSLSSLQTKQISYAVRHADTWIVSRSRTNYGDQMLQYRLPKVLNTMSLLGVEVEVISKKCLRSRFVEL